MSFIAYQKVGMMTITLAQVNAENWENALQLSVHPDQLRFVAEYTPIVAIGLAKALIRPYQMIWLPYAIYAADQLVGFLELAYKPENEHQYWLFHFFIDQSQQGKGYGKQALEVLIQWVQENYPLCREIKLSVNPENVVAQQLYSRRGFEPTGEAFDNGELVYALRLS
jgi:diamine N-acetyltransferase